MEQVAVTCSIVGGVELRLFDGRFEDGTGAHHKIASGWCVLRGPTGRGAGVNSPGSGAPQVTMVDAKFWRAWLSRNADTALVTSGAIRGPSIEEMDGGDAAPAGSTGEGGRDDPAPEFPSDPFVVKSTNAEDSSDGASAAIASFGDVGDAGASEAKTSDLLAPASFR